MTHRPALLSDGTLVDATIYTRACWRERRGEVLEHGARFVVEVAASEDNIIVAQLLMLDRDDLLAFLRERRPVFVALASLESEPARELLVLALMIERAKTGALLH